MVRSHLVNKLKKYIKLSDNREEKFYFEFRLLKLVENIEKGAFRSSLLYYFLSSIVTLGSIIVPSLLSIQDKTLEADPDEGEQKQHRLNVYWTVWGMSMCVTVSNAFIKLLALDKTYITRNLRLNQYRHEIMSYISKSGKYNTTDDNIRFTTLVQNIEKIKEYQTLEEYTPQQHNNDVDEPPKRSENDLQNVTMI